MLEGIDLNQRIEFVSSYDKLEPKTVFVLRPLSGVELLGLGGTIEGGKIKLTRDYILDLISKSLVEIKNSESGKTNQEMVESLNFLVLGELINRIADINSLKNEN